MTDAPPPNAPPDHDAVLDARALRCPLPVLKARKRLLAMRPDERLLLRADDPLSAIDVPHFCAETGHTLVWSGRAEDELRFVIARG